MRRILTTTATTLAAAWSIGCVEVSGPVIDAPDWKFPFDTTGIDFEWSGQIAQGDQIEIKGVFGGITAASTSGSDVLVTARKTGLWNDVSEVDIDVVVHAGGVTICAVYPDVAGQRPNRCGVGDDGHVSVRDSAWGAVRVEFTVLVPEGVTFVGRTVNGDVEALDMLSDAFLTTVSGDALVSTTGIASAITVSGSISASIGGTDWGRNLEFLTVAGDISVTVPSETNADVEASVQSGSITSDFPLTQDSSGDKRGTIGSGGWMLLLATVDGDILLERGN
jgi:hypothetical protein